MKRRIEENPQILFQVVKILREVLELDRKGDLEAELAADIQVI